MGKAFDADCYIYTSAKSYSPPKGLELAADIYRGPVVGDTTRWERPFRLVVLGNTERPQYFRNMWYEPLIGSVKNGVVSPDTKGIPDLTAEARMQHEQ